MDYPTCPHAQGRGMATNVFYRLINDNLVIVYWCAQCDDEFYREPNEQERNRAKELGITK